MRHIYSPSIDAEVVIEKTDCSHEFLLNENMGFFGSKPSRCHILYLLNTTLLVDKSTTYVHAKYLSLFHDFQRIHTYNYGAATLAHIYYSYIIRSYTIFYYTKPSLHTNQYTKY
ncbi:hypothetical protein Ahy_B01g054687 [Arachis hypogaea]|uniref:Aminotransferase-like plant mobile domain-containing protein n=1 Tax=Arachis hypogaea TaxID=3818 RepID=A0A445AU54_ARAHY|nr:hypothetical protein Ahy_B01g054687 [Arachis hypogaea]